MARRWFRHSCSLSEKPRSRSAWASRKKLATVEAAVSLSSWRLHCVNPLKQQWQPLLAAAPPNFSLVASPPRVDISSAIALHERRSCTMLRLSEIPSRGASAFRERLGAVRIGRAPRAAHRVDPQLAELGLKLISWPPAEILPAKNRWWHLRIWRARPARFLVHLGWLALNSTRRLRHSVARVICCEGEILPKYDLVKIFEPLAQTTSTSLFHLGWSANTAIAHTSLHLTHSTPPHSTTLVFASNHFISPSNHRSWLQSGVSPGLERY